MEEHMKKWIGIIISLVLMAGALAACSKPTGNNSQTTPADNSEVSSQDNVANTPTPSEEQPEEEDNEAAWPRTIIDATGNEIVLEKKPERVALLHVVYLEYLLSLEAPPTAAALGNAQGEVEALESSELLWPYLKDEDIIMLGNSRNLNLEAVLAAQPDVIVTFYSPAGLEQYEQLLEIAPVIQINYSDTWQNQLMLCAQVMGLEAKAEEVIDEVEQLTAKTKETLAPYTDQTFGLFRTDGKSFISQGIASYYEAFGLTKPNGFTDAADTLSLEAVAEMNPYYIVFQHNLEVATAFVQSMEDSSIWKSLDAVKNNRVYYFDENMNSYGPLSLKLAAEKITDIYTR
jgi:iron complex transport system substrate-binding protein